MVGFNPKNPTKYAGTDKYITFFVTRNREPTSADYRQPETGALYSVGTVWQVGKNPSTGVEGELWMLSKIVANIAYWVQIVGSTGPALEFEVDAATAPGVNPVTPDGAGLTTITADVVAAHSIPLRTHTTALNQYTIEAQYSSAINATDATKVGFCAFNDDFFTVDASGFVSVSGTGLGRTITGDTGGALSPTAGNWNLLGSGSITSVGSGSTLTYQLQGLTNHALLVGAGTTTITKLAVGATGTVLIGNTAADPSFSATPSVTSITFGSGTALSTYQQGTFTPGISFGGGTTGITYSNQDGKYTQIGNLLHFSLTISLSNKGSSTGAAKITGFPVNSVGSGVIGFMQADLLDLSANFTYFFANYDNGATTATLYQGGDNNALSGLTDTNFANNTTLRLTGFYFTS